jgi:hypothetical protein
MSVIAFNFTKIAGERKTGPAGKLNIKATSNVTDVKEQQLGNQKTLKFTFTHTIAYEPGFATLAMEGDVLVLSNDKEAKETVEGFKKNKRFSPALTQKVMNTILNRVSIQSLVMSRDLNLPAPIKLPRLLMETKDVKKK